MSRSRLDNNDIRAHIGQVGYDAAISTFDEVSWKFLKRLFLLPEKYQASVSYQLIKLETISTS